MSRRNRKKTLIFWDAATGVFMNEAGSVCVFDEFPDQPVEKKTFDEALAYVRGWKDADRYQLYVTNTDADPEDT